MKTAKKPTSQRRFAKHAAPGKPMILGEQHKAVAGAVTLFPTQVSCGSCALCWNSSEPIVFISH